MEAAVTRGRHRRHRGEPGETRDRGFGALEWSQDGRTIWARNRRAGQGRSAELLQQRHGQDKKRPEVLYQETFVCIVGSSRRLARRRLSLKQYLALPHAIVETWERQQTPVDRRLAELGAKRHAVLSLPFFVPTVIAIARTDLVLTLPRRLARIMASIADVRVVEPPREIKGFSYFMAWHPRLTSEQAHTWFREHLRQIARTI